jgi:transcriptional regulator with XRE-family HTH domain
MPTPEIGVQEVLNLVRVVMRRQKRTQLEVQEVLGWGRSSISQMMTGQKSVRLGQLLDLLRALELEQGEFFAELYGLKPPVKVARLDEVHELGSQVEALRSELHDMALRLHCLEGEEPELALVRA